MSKLGQKIIQGLQEAIAGDLGAVTIEGQRWVRADVLRADQQEIMRINNSLRDVLLTVRDNLSSLMTAYPDRFPRHAFQGTYDLVCETVGSPAQVPTSAYDE